MTTLTTRPDLRRRTVYTTGQAADICKVAPRTVTVWMDTGKLKGYRIPSRGDGPGDRRIPRESLVEFLRLHGMPTFGLESAHLVKVLLVGLDAATSAAVRSHLPDADGYLLHDAADAFQAGASLSDFRPDAILIDLVLGRSDACGIARRVRQIAAGGDCPLLVALAGEDEADPDALATAGGFDEAFKRPFDTAAVAACVAAAVGEDRA